MLSLTDASLAVRRLSPLGALAGICDVPRIPFPLGLEVGIDALWGPTAWP